MAKAQTTWVLVADGARARLLVSEGGGGSLRSALGQEYIGTNLASRDIASDREGRTFDRAGQGRHAMEPSTDPHEHAKHVFAHEIAEILDSARKDNAFDTLVVVAPPQALGDLRAEFSEPLQRMVSAEVRKDLTKVPTRDLPDHLGDVLEP